MYSCSCDLQQEHESLLKNRWSSLYFSKNVSAISKMSWWLTWKILHRPWKVWGFGGLTTSPNAWFEGTSCILTLLKVSIFGLTMHEGYLELEERQNTNVKCIKMVTQSPTPPGNAYVPLTYIGAFYSYCGWWSPRQWSASNNYSKIHIAFRRNEWKWSRFMFSWCVMFEWDAIHWTSWTEANAKGLYFIHQR